eukprot:g4849.t1
MTGSTQRVQDKKCTIHCDFMGSGNAFGLPIFYSHTLPLFSTAGAVPGITCNFCCLCELWPHKLAKRKEEIIKKTQIPSRSNTSSWGPDFPGPDFPVPTIQHHFHKIWPYCDCKMSFSKHDAKQFLKWCTLINGGMFAFSSLLWLSPAQGTLVKLGSAMHGVSAEMLRSKYLDALILYKCMFVFFNMVPYIALEYSSKE